MANIVSDHMRMLVKESMEDAAKYWKDQDVFTKVMQNHIRNTAKILKTEYKDRLSARAKDALKKPVKLIGKAMKGVGKGFKSVGLSIMGVYGWLIQLMDSLGILQPLFDVINALLAVFGGQLMQALMPAFQELFSVLLSPEIMGLLKMLANIFAAALIPIIQTFAIVLQALMPVFDALMPILKTLEPIIYMLAKVFGLLITVALLPLAYAVYGVGMFIASLIDAFTFGTAGAMKSWQGLMSPILGSLLGAVPQVMALQHGGLVTSPTLAIIGERGPEAVIPLNKMGEQGVRNKKVVWAIEDLGEKIDFMHYTIKEQERMK